MSHYSGIIFEIDKEIDNALHYTIDSSLIDENLTDFPLGIKIESSTGFMSGLSADDWQYIHATVDEVECYIEVEKWDITNEEAVLWVKIPVVSSGTDTIVKIEIGAINHGVSNPSSINDDTVTITTQSLSGMVYSPDGTSCVMGGHYDDLVYQWDLSTSPWSLPSGNPDNAYSSWNSQLNIHGVCFANDGYLLFLIGTSPYQLQKWSLSTPYDISTKSLSQYVYLADYRGFTVSNDGLHLAIAGKIYSFGTAYDLSTLSLDGTFSTNTFACFASNDGKRIYSVHTDRYTIFMQYLAIAWDYSSASEEITLFTVDSGTYESIKSVYVREKNDTVDIYLNEGVYQNTHEIIVYNDINIGHIGETGDIEAVNVWDENFNAVYHLDESPSGGVDCIKDSSHKLNHGSPYGSMTSTDSVEGIICNAIDFDGVDDRIDSKNNIDISGNQGRTIMVSVKTNDNSSYMPIFTFGNATTGNLFSLALDGGSLIRVALTNGNRIFSCVYADSTWKRIAIRLNGSDATGLDLFLDGEQATVSSTSNVSIDTTDTILTIASAVSSYFFDGILDEMHVVNTNLSSAWLKADYHNVANTLITYSSGEPSVPQTYEPNISSFILGMGENIGRLIDVERALNESFSLNENTSTLYKQLFESIYINDQFGRIREINTNCSANINLNEQTYSSNANVMEIGAVSTFSLSVENYLIRALSYLSTGRLRLNEESGAFLAAVETDGMMGGECGFNVSCDANIASATFTGIEEAIGFSGVPTRINDLFEVESLSAIAFNGMTSKEMESTGAIIPSLGINENVECIRTVNPMILDNNISINSEAGCFNFTQWANENLDKAVYSYNLKITGSLDGLDDYNLSGLRSFQFKRNEDGRSYLSCVMPYDVDVLSAIMERSSGHLVIDMAATINGLESLRETIIDVEFSNVRYDRGGESQSMTITGYIDENKSSNTIYLTSVTGETMLTDGRLSYRLARPDFYMSPGDTVFYEGRSIVVSHIQTIVSQTTHYTEISE